jgi:hypothetical protein
MASKKKESTKQFIERRNKDEQLKHKTIPDISHKSQGKDKGKVKVKEDHAHKFEAGRHPLIALQQHSGLVKKKTAKKLEKSAHRAKKNRIEGK